MPTIYNGSMKRIKRSDLLTLESPIDQTFVIEYLKDFNAERAAIAAGLDPADAYVTRHRKDISDCIANLLLYEYLPMQYDPSWILFELVDNHRLARQAGNLNASNKALEVLARHSQIDAFAAEKVQIIGDEEITARLARKKKKPSDFDFG